MTAARKIGFLGGGNMALALARGLIARGGFAPADLFIAEPLAARRAELERELGVRTTADNAALVAFADTVVLATKPQVALRVLEELKGVHNATKLLISIAAGLPLAALEAALRTAPNPTPRVIRTMPNTPALVGEGATGIARGGVATDEDLAHAVALFEAVGVAVVVSESSLDAVTGLSGSGPAYVFQFIEALADGGVRAGLPRDVALRLATQTVRGAATLALETGAHPGELKDRVTSPGGTTIAGVYALERGGLRGTVMDAVAAATARSVELGKG